VQSADLLDIFRHFYDAFFLLCSRNS